MCVPRGKDSRNKEGREGICRREKKKRVQTGATQNGFYSYELIMIIFFLNFLFASLLFPNSSSSCLLLLCFGRLGRLGLLLLFWWLGRSSSSSSSHCRVLNAREDSFRGREGGTRYQSRSSANVSK